MAKKSKVDLSPTGESLHNPFAALDTTGLPAGETPPPVEKPATKPGKLGRVVLRRETAHRGGKSVIVVYDFPPSIGGAKIEELARKLKSACACGGTAKDRTIEVQADQPARIRTLLEQEGFRVAGITS